MICLNQTGGQDRIAWYDYARAFAIILVVFTHCHEISGWTSVLPVSISYSIDRLGVPIFFMLSGALMIPKTSSMPVLAFYRRRWRIPQFVFLLFLWSVLTNAEAMVAEQHFNFGHSFHIALLTQNGIFKVGGRAMQMWFMFAIIEIYLVLPFIARLAERLSVGETMIFIAVMVLFYQFRDTLTVAMRLPTNNILYCTGADFIGPYIPYFLAGYLVARRIEIPRTALVNVLCAAVVAASIAFPIWLDLFYNEANGGGIHWYSSSLPILFGSIGLFILFKNVAGTCAYAPKWVVLLSRCSFGMFLTHVFFIFAAKAAMAHFGVSLGIYASAAVFYAFSFCASFAFTALLSKVRGLKFLVM